MRPEVIVVGTSVGGLLALGALLKRLPAGYTIPTVIVQHRSVNSGELLLRELRRYTSIRVLEPSDKDPVSPGRIYIAPADYHLLVEQGEFRLSTEGPVSYARPSIDVLFESAADAYGRRTVGVVLTGANSDGAWGATCIKQAGGVIIVQNPEEAECPVMPGAAINATSVDYVLSLSDIGAYLTSLQDEQG